ncbi:hypothetical protein ACQPYK_49035 (plasmid) [Streptosporangium sp. CA-135522]|uniref:hypothetical protein n=1 Tax=Streptosporangium sp. CA-135522 TaxID=3240072 RepID=UPI003D934C1F
MASTDPISHEMKLVAIALNSVYESADGCGMDRIATQDAIKAIAEAVYTETRDKDEATAAVLRTRWLDMCTVTTAIEEIR